MIKYHRNEIILTFLDAVLAAELGSQLLAENKKLTAQVTEKDDEIKLLKERVQNVEDTLLEMAQR